MQVILTEQEYNDLKNAAVNAEANALKKIEAEVYARAAKAGPILESSLLHAIRYGSLCATGPAHEMSKSLRAFWDAVFPNTK